MATAGRTRVISSCLTCRRRKVKCDQVHPVCGACTRGNHVCTWLDQAQALGQMGGSGRVSKPGCASGKALKSDNVYSRLERLEQLLVRAVADKDEERKTTTTTKTTTMTTTRCSVEVVEEKQCQGTPSSNSQTSCGSGVTSGDREGILILDGGQSQFVSSLHYALLAEDIQDIKALLGDKTDEERKEIPQHSLVDLLSLGRAGAGSDLEQLLPDAQQHRDMLLDIYFLNVDPLVGITHKPTLLRKFAMYNREMHPLAFAVYFSAVNSLPYCTVLDKFGQSKDVLLGRLQLGVEISLARENYLTTASLEVFQGFVLWLMCITVEEDMGKAWVLLGIAIRIAFNQGLHQDPSLFSSGSMDAVTIESRRRLWHAICKMDFRAAECKGQEPSITEDSYTTLLPRNVNDEDLIDGASPGPTAHDEQKFTSQSFLVSTYTVFKMMRRVIQSTYRLEKRMMDAELHGTPRPVLLRELQNLYEQMKSQIKETKALTQQKVLQYCNAGTPLQKICGNITLLMEWRCHLLFWLRLPRDYRGVALGEDLRTIVFEKSIGCIELLNKTLMDPANDCFKWHLSGIASFQALTHVLSELRNPLFDVPDQQRAILALQTCRVLENQTRGKAWQAVRNMIDKAVAEYETSPRKRSQEPRPHTNSGVRPSISPSPNATQPNDRMAAYLSTLDLRHDFPTQAVSGQSAHQSQPAQSQQVQMQVNLLQSIHPTREHAPPLWDMLEPNKINENNNSNYDPASSFDFGFWGDPFQYQNDPNLMAIDDLYYPWIG